MVISKTGVSSVFTTEATPTVKLQNHVLGKWTVVDSGQAVDNGTKYIYFYLFSHSNLSCFHVHEPFYFQ